MALGFISQAPGSMDVGAGRVSVVAMGGTGRTLRG